MKKIIFLLLTFFILTSCNNQSAQYSQEVGNSASAPYEIGSVDTAFKLIGPDHKIEVGGIPDPKIQGITCFYSRAKTGGIAGGIGLAEDTSDASVACRQTGTIVFKQAIK